MRNLSAKSLHEAIVSTKKSSAMPIIKETKQ